MISSIYNRNNVVGIDEVCCGTELQQQWQRVPVHSALCLQCSSATLSEPGDGRHGQASWF